MKNNWGMNNARFRSLFPLSSVHFDEVMTCSSSLQVGVPAFWATKRESEARHGPLRVSLNRKPSILRLTHQLEKKTLRQQTKRRTSRATQTHAVSFVSRSSASTETQAVPPTRTAFSGVFSAVAAFRTFASVRCINSIL